MTKWLVGALIAISSTAYADQTLLQELCETTAFNQEMTVTMATPVVIAHHRNGQMLAGKESNSLDLSVFAPLLIADNQVSGDCLAYLQHRGVLRVSSSEAEVTDFGSEPVLARVFFEFDRSKLSKTSVKILEHIASKLLQSPSLVKIEGHTDSRGSEIYNMELGLRRSEEVKSFLVEKGLNPETLFVSSQGESKPIADNSTSTGREKNRRVELKI